MALVSEAERIGVLQEWGLSPSLISLANGEAPHPLLSSGFLGPPREFYRLWASLEDPLRPPPGSQFVPLWEFAQIVTGVWKNEGRLEFIRSAYGSPERYEIVARTEQGLWAAIFDFLYEGGAALEELEAAADAAGFDYLARLLFVRRASDSADEPVDADFHADYLRVLVESIDRESK